MKITTIILTKNEEDSIAKAIHSVRFSQEVIVVDDASEDKTKEVAQKEGARVVAHASNGNFAQQRNWAMEQAKTDWILFIDADEELSKEAQSELDQMTGESGIVAYAIPRRDFFWQTELKYGETKKARTQGIIRLIRKGQGKWEGAVHEEFIPTQTEKKIQGFINHYSHDTLASFITDINTYSTIRAKELSLMGKKTNVVKIVFVPFGKFLYTYFFLGGFRDGAAGFVYSFVMSFHSFLVRAKLFTQTYV